MVNLEKLYIGKNKISKIEVGFNFVFIADSHYICNYLSQNLGALGKLEVLSVRAIDLLLLEGWTASVVCRNSISFTMPSSLSRGWTMW